MTQNCDNCDDFIVIECENADNIEAIIVDK